MDKSRKILLCVAVLLALSLCLVLSPIQIQAGSNHSLAAPHVEGLPGSTVEVPVYLTSPGDVAGVQFELGFNPALLTYQGVAPGLHVPGFSPSANKMGSDRVRVIIYHPGGALIPSGTIEIAVLTFKVAEDAPVSAVCQLEFSEGKLVDTNAAVITPVVLNQGSFTVEAPPVNQYTITIETEGQGSTDPVAGDYTYNEGTPVTLTATASDGWQFEKWVVGTDEYDQPNIELAMDTHKTATAYFIISQKLTAAHVEGLPGSTVQVPVNLTSTGNVAGVQFDLSFDPSLLSYQDVTPGFHLTAGFWPSANVIDGNKARVIIYHPQNDTLPSGTGEIALITFKVADDALVGDDCPLMFSGVTFGDIHEQKITPVTLNAGSFTVIPPVTYDVTVTADPAAGGTVTGGGTFDCGASVTVTANASEGYDFVKWTEGGVLVTGAGASYEFTATANRNLIANFTAQDPPEQYTLTVETEGQGSTNPATGDHVYDDGTVATLTATAAAGWQFEKWVVGETEHAQPTIDVTMDADKTAKAYFKQKPTPSPGPGVVTAPVDKTPPVVQSTDPDDGASKVALDKLITVTFSEKVKAGTAYEKITLKDKDVVSVSFAKGVKDEILTITPDGALAYNTLYTVFLPAGAVQDLAGNKLEEDYSFSFTTRCITFTDMPGHWAQETVQRLACLSIINGYPDKTFRPDNFITRMEATVILVRMLNLAPANAEDIAALNAQFTDAANVPVWGLNDAAAAYREGLVKGYLHSDGSKTFEAAKNISREELALIISRILVKELGPTTPAELTFTDACEISVWATEGVGIAVAKSIVVGYLDNTFRPRNNVTRAETAAMIERLYDNIY